MAKVIAAFITAAGAVIAAMIVHGFIDGWSDPPAPPQPQGPTSTAPATVPIVTYFTLRTEVVGQGSMSSEGGDFREGSSLPLSPAPADGWQFLRWEGDCSGTAIPCHLLMDSDKRVTAVFEEMPASEEPTPSPTTVRLSSDLQTLQFRPAAEPRTVNEGRVLLEGCVVRDVTLQQYDRDMAPLRGLDKEIGGSTRGAHILDSWRQIVGTNILEIDVREWNNLPGTSGQLRYRVFYEVQQPHDLDCSRIQWR